MKQQALQVKNIAVVTALINFACAGACNLLCAWLLQHQHKNVAMDNVSIAMDSGITCLCIGLSVVYCCYPTVKKALAQGLILPAHGLLVHVPLKRFPQGLVFSAAAFALWLLVVIAVCTLTQTQVLTVGGYMVYKAILGGITAAVIGVCTVYRGVARG